MKYFVNKPERTRYIRKRNKTSKNIFANEAKTGWRTNPQRKDGQLVSRKVAWQRILANANGEYRKSQKYFLSGMF